VFNRLFLELLKLVIHYSGFLSVTYIGEKRKYGL
jgi:hypothetical protein